jgi:hypothetical protein
MSRCRSCDAEIVWATSATGKAMPLNAKPDPMGNVRLYGPNGARSAVVLAAEKLKLARTAGVPLYMPHHATCPQGGAWRKR